MAEPWKLRLLPASFRGIPFFVESHELSGGRNLVPHEPPDRNTVFTEDVGKKTKVFSIDAHVLGDNYFFIRDGLIKAMDDDTSGVLIHPYLGVKDVRPGAYTISESAAEGRICKFTLQFMEAGAPSMPVAIIDAVTGFITDVVSAVAMVQNAFQLAFTIAQMPGHAVDAVVALVHDFTGTIRNGLTKVGLRRDQLADVESTLAKIDEAAESLVRNPASLAAEFDSAIDSIGAIVVDPPNRFTIDSSSGRDDKIDAFTDLVNYSADIPEPTTPTRAQQAQNARAMQGLIKQLAAIRLSEQVVRKAFNTIDEALKYRSNVNDSFEALMLETDSDDVYTALANLAAKFIQAVPNAGTSTATTRLITIDTATPALAVAYDLYDSIDNEQDIIDRNGVRNPAFVAGEIEVISG